MKNLRFVKSLLLLSVVLFASSEVRAQGGEARVAAWQVTRFDITANVESGAASRGVTARAVVSARNVGAGEGRTFTVRLNPLAEVKAASVGGAQARFTTNTEALTNLLRAQVVLPAAVEPGGTVNV